jgi:hypothetical protein
MEKQIILEINRLNELMNLPLIMEGPGDKVEKFLKIIKQFLSIAENEKSLIKKYVKGVQLSDDETKLLIASLKRDDTIITTLEKKIREPGMLSANELTEATAKLNDLKALKNTIHPSEDLLLIKKWFHLTEEGKLLYGDFRPFISQKTLTTLENNKSKFLDGTVEYLSPIHRLELADACEKIGTNIQTVLSKVKLPPNQTEVLEKSSGFLREFGREVKNNPESASKKVKGYGKLAWQVVKILVVSASLIGAYKSGCKGDVPFLDSIMKFFGWCKGGSESNNGGGDGKYD